MNQDTRRGPLRRITVLDFTRMRAGPTCVRQLADWGANVIKIEERPSARQADDFMPRHGPDFQNLQRNKRSVTLDLKSPAGVAIVHRMAKQADVVVENFRPDVKSRLRIDYETLRAINPRLVYASISGYGQDGPYRDLPGVDPIVQGISGFMSITGEPGRGPMRAGTAIFDTTAGLFGALGVLTALYERESSNQGQWVQTSLLQAAAFMLDFQAARYLIRGEVPEQVGNNHPTSCPMGTYRARDGYVNIAPTPPMWPNLCKAMGREDLAGDPKYATNEIRLRHRAELNVLIEAFTSRFTREELTQRLDAADIPCGPINAIDEAFADPQVRHLGIAQQVQSKRLGTLTLLGQPFTLERTPSALTSAAPEPGEHSEQVLAEFGYSKEEIARYREAGVL